MTIKKITKQWLIPAMLMGSAAAFSPAFAQQYAANFKGTDIQEFINIVGKNLNRTIIVDPSVRGKVNVRSYDLLNDEQYYQFFLNVLEVYGFAIVEMENNIIKVIKDKDAKYGNIRVADDAKPGMGDEMVTRIVPLYNVEAKQLAPLLRQLNDNAGGGNVVNYDPSNVIMITGRAAVVNKLVEIVKKVDKQGDTAVEVVQLKHASAGEMVRIIDTLNRSKKDKNSNNKTSVVADERTNAVVISGDEKNRERIIGIIKVLDGELKTTGNTKVIYLKHAIAKDLVEVLSGFAESLEKKAEGGTSKSSSRSSNNSRNDITIVAHEDTNALVITAEKDQMGTLESVIRQLDIRRAQVLVEAIIVEVAVGDEVGFGIQWGSAAGGFTQFNNLGPTIGEIGAGIWQAQPTKASNTCSGAGDTQNCTNNPDKRGDITTLATALSKVNGMAWGVAAGDFGALIQAVSSDTNSNVLATPSITTLDNQEASFVVGDEVPVLTGATASASNSNPFQTVERKEVGIKLKVIPQINEGTGVKLTIEQEVSNINGKTSVDVTFGTRRLTTTVMADSGKVVVLGGLLQESVQESVQKVPFLGDIPIIGHLFRSSSSGVTKKNLMVFIKPTIIRDDSTMEGIAGRKYNYFRGVQLEQQARGINLMPTVKPPILDEWNSNVPDDVRKIVEDFEKGKQMETRIRDTDSTLKYIEEKKQQSDKVEG